MFRILILYFVFILGFGAVNMLSGEFDFNNDTTISANDNDTNTDIDEDEDIEDDEDEDDIIEDDNSTKKVKETKEEIKEEIKKEIKYIKLEEDDNDTTPIIGQDIEGLAEETPIFDAVRNEDIDVVEYFIKHKININVANENGYTPLHIAVKAQNFQIVQSLIKAGANVNSEDYVDETPLIDAVRNIEEKGDINTKIAKALICAGANRDVVDQNGKAVAGYATKDYNTLVILKDKDISPYCGVVPVKKHITTIYVDPQRQIKDEIYVALNNEFKDDLEKWKAEIDKIHLTFTFKKKELMFEDDKDILRLAFKKVLREFFPRYIKVVSNYKDKIKNILVEGDTSVVYDGILSEKEKFKTNNKLSIERADEVLEYALDIHNPIIIENEKWLTKVMNTKSASLTDSEETTNRIKFTIVPINIMYDGKPPIDNNETNTTVDDGNITLDNNETDEIQDTITDSQDENETITNSVDEIQNDENNTDENQNFTFTDWKGNTIVVKDGKIVDENETSENITENDIQDQNITTDETSENDIQDQNITTDEIIEDMTQDTNISNDEISENITEDDVNTTNSEDASIVIEIDDDLDNNTTVEESSDSDNTLDNEVDTEESSDEDDEIQDINTSTPLTAIDVVDDINDEDEDINDDSVASGSGDEKYMEDTGTIAP